MCLFRYCLWLLECSHDTGKQYAVMFFGRAFQYKVILNVFGKQVGPAPCFLFHRVV
jgi:HIV-1 Vpr-binding protein